MRPRGKSNKKKNIIWTRRRAATQGFERGRERGKNTHTQNVARRKVDTLRSGEVRPKIKSKTVTVVKVKVSLCLTKYVMKMYRGVEVQLHSLLTLALNGAITALGGNGTPVVQLTILTQLPRVHLTVITSRK
jgi:hypothetical protein